MPTVSGSKDCRSDVRSSPSTVRSAASCVRSPISCRAGSAAPPRRSSGSARGRSVRSRRSAFSPSPFSTALVVGGQIGRLGDWLLVAIGFGIEDVKINGQQGDLRDRGPRAARSRRLAHLASTSPMRRSSSAQLPWVEHVTRAKILSGHARDRDHRAQALRALAARRRGPRHRPERRTEIVPLDESRFAKLPFMVGGGANETAQPFLADLLTQPDIAGADARRGAGRRPPLGPASRQRRHRQAAGEGRHARRSRSWSSSIPSSQLLARDVVVIDLRLPDRVTVRLPEGRSLEDVTSEGGAPKQGKTRT